MKDLFKEYFAPTDKAFEALWSEAIICVDANVLLNFYRYSPEAQNALREQLSAVEAQLFLPNQAGEEYLRNRAIVINEQVKKYDETVGEIEKLSKRFDQKNSHPFLSKKDHKKFGKNLTDLAENLTAQKESVSQITENDDQLTFLTNLFDGKTGSSYGTEKAAEIYKDGEKRYNDNIPPGYKDSSKDKDSSGIKKYGDLLLWFQILDKAKELEKSVIFVTDDRKEDWWEKASGKTIGPRKELRKEFHTKIEKEFWMYPTHRFVEESSNLHGSKVDKKVIEEIELVSIKRSRKGRRGRSGVKRSLGAGMAVSQYIKHSGPNFQSGYLNIYVAEDTEYPCGHVEFSPHFRSTPIVNLSVLDTEEKNYNVKPRSLVVRPDGFLIELEANNGLVKEGIYRIEYSAKIKADSDSFNNAD